MRNPNIVINGRSSILASQVVDIELVAEIRDGKRVYESVPAVRIGENRYRLLHSPGFAPGAASGDEIEVDQSEVSGFRVVKHSGNLCVQLFLSKCDCEERTTIVGIVESVGGWLDGGYDDPAGTLLVFTIPVSSGFDAIEAAMIRIAAECAVDRWLYGNVYDMRDGVTPLNWWL